MEEWGINVHEGKCRILAINPGAITTSIGVFENDRPLIERIISHDQDGQEADVAQQAPLRKLAILEELDRDGFNLSKIDAVCAAGGLLSPIEGGTYSVNGLMLDDLLHARYGQHPSNLGAVLAAGIGEDLNIPAYIADPPVVDELEEVARISGCPLVERKSIFHALNQKAAARRTAKELGKEYEDLHLIVVHLGTGVSIGVHRSGRVIDVNNCLDGEGPFSLERSGTVPFGGLLRLWQSGSRSNEEIKKSLVGNGGISGYLGISGLDQLGERIQGGDGRAELILNAFAYQTAKEIAAGASVLYGHVDGIVLTGPCSIYKFLTDRISERVSWIADVHVEPADNELQALAEGALRVVMYREKAKEYIRQ